MSKEEDVVLWALMIIGLIGYPLLIVLGWGYLVYLGFSVAALIFGILYVIFVFGIGFLWVLLLAAILNAILS